MVLTLEAQRELARRLVEAEQSGRRLALGPGDVEGMTLADAYQVQAETAALRSAAGLAQVGWKTMGTNAALRARFGATEPARGYLFETALVQGSVSGEGHSVITEPEIAFVLAQDMQGPGVTAQDVLAATKEVCGAIEVAWSRLEAQPSNVALVADNAAAARVVLAQRRLSVAEVGDLASISVEFLQNGETVRTGTGKEVYGSPANAVAWLANHLAEHDLRLQAGQVIIAGSLTLPLETRAGDTVRARFDVLGEVEVRIT